MPLRVPRAVPLATVCLAVAAAAAPSAGAVPGPSREVVATFRAGVRTIGE